MAVESVAKQNEQACNRWVDDVINGGNAAAIDDLVTPDAVAHDLSAKPYVLSEFEGKSLREQSKMAIEFRKRHYDDFQLQMDLMLSDGDKVAVLSTVRATRNGKKLTTRMMDFIRFEDGKMAEVWELSDDLGFFQQLGVVPDAPELLAEAGFPT